MYDAILTVHTNPHGCGVAKFNLQLAERLGVPLLVIGTMDSLKCSYPLVSIHPRELNGHAPDLPAHYDLFLHSSLPAGRPFRPHREKPRRVFAGNVVIADAVRGIYPDVEVLFCPSLVEGRKDPGGVRILTFGMAGRLIPDYHRKLKAVLDENTQPYSVNLSCAVHEGLSWSDTMGETWRVLQDIYGHHARLLGYLADDALQEEMYRSTAVAAFFNLGARSNNTSLWAAMHHGAPVITNLDLYSPDALIHDVSVFDIAKMTEWPTPDRLRVIRFGGITTAGQHDWARLLTAMEAKVTA